MVMDDLIFNEQKEGQDQERPKGFANLINDVTFKKVFACKETMISFLNEIVKQPLVTDVTFLNTEAYAGTEDDRMAIFDIACRGQDGSEFIVEMQCAPQEYFRDRMLTPRNTGTCVASGGTISSNL